LRSISFLSSGGAGPADAGQNPITRRIFHWVRGTLCPCGRPRATLASQSAIARLESGQTLPSTKTLLRYAEATGSKFHLRLSAA
jgi:transcriptional regulator with XRE-family HTH domain